MNVMDVFLFHYDRNEMAAHAGVYLRDIDDGVSVLAWVALRDSATDKLRPFGTCAVIPKGHVVRVSPMYEMPTEDEVPFDDQMIDASMIRHVFVKEDVGRYVRRCDHFVGIEDIGRIIHYVDERFVVTESNASGVWLTAQGQDLMVAGDYTVPTVTVAIQAWWLCLYVVHPNGDVFEVLWEEIGTDHVPDPRIVADWARSKGYGIEELALELMVGRWVSIEKGG